MQKVLAVLVVVLVMAAVPASAQLLGLPVAEGAAALEPGAMAVSGGITIGDNVNMYGGRFRMGLMEGMDIFADAGLLDPDGAKMGPAIQFGGKFALPLDIPFDVAVRGALGYGMYDLKTTAGDFVAVSGDVDVLTINVGGVASMDIDMITVYGFLGLNHTRSKVTIKMAGLGSASGSHSDTDPALAAGAILKLNEQISLYAELAYIDDPFFSIGGGLSF